MPTWPGAQVSIGLGVLCGGYRTCAPCISCAALTLSCPAPDINPAWYTGRGIRPVGRFGRRRAALRDVTVPGLRCRLSCLPLEGGAKFSHHG
ncbi:Prolactin-releasing peptide [Lemmus lemmus]